MTRRALNIWLTNLLALSTIPDCSARVSDTRTLPQYKVIHSVYGDIGTYANSIYGQGDIITIRTDVRLLVSLLGIILYRESADRITILKRPSRLPELRKTPPMIFRHKSHVGEPIPAILRPTSYLPHRIEYR